MAIHSVPPPQFYTWTFPAASVRVRILLDVIRKLQDLLTVAAHENAGRPECTGILLGTTGHSTEISDVVPCTNVRPGAIPAALQSLKASDGIKPVGFYRTEFDQRLHLTENDRAIARKYFSDAGDVFLIVHVSANGPDTATFFFWDDAQIHADFAFLEFPFDVSGLVARERLRTPEVEKRPPVPLDPEPEALPAPALPAVAQSHAPAFRLSSKRVSQAAVAMLLLCAGFFGFRVNWRSQDASVPGTAASAARQPAEKSAPAASRTPLRQSSSTQSGSQLPASVPRSEAMQERAASPSSLSPAVYHRPPAVNPASAGTADRSINIRKENAASGGRLVPPKFLSGKNPKYPADAYRAHLEGTVVVDAFIETDGSARKIVVISGPSVFREAAVNAVRGWTFSPAHINAKRVPGTARLEVKFHGNW